jgi:hypothetical protein
MLQMSTFPTQLDGKSHLFQDCCIWVVMHFNSILVLNHFTSKFTILQFVILHFLVGSSAAFQIIA